LKKEKKKTNSKSNYIINWIKKKKHYSAKYIKSIKIFKGKKYGHTAANQLNNDFENDIRTELFSKNNNKKKIKLNKTEKVIFIKEEISKSISANWILDTRVSLSMTDQFDLYKKGFLKSLYKVFI